MLGTVASWSEEQSYETLGTWSLRRDDWRGCDTAAGCGGSQPSIGARASVPQGRATTPQADRSGSWMRRQTTAQTLLYVSDASYYDYNDYVYVFSYPDGEPVGTLTGFMRPAGLCATKAGRVFITIQTLERCSSTFTAGLHR